MDENEEIQGFEMYREDMIYGVFASHSLGKNHKKRRRVLGGVSVTMSDYSKPVDFVLTGDKGTDHSDQDKGTRNGCKDVLKGNNVGGFERHTKGIGMKLLAKMGYKGGGLGKNQEGIVVPIEVKLMPKYMALGFNGYQENHNFATTYDQKRGKRKLHELEVVCRRVLEARENHMPMEELQYNISLAAELAELDVEKIDRDLRTARETVVALQEEKVVLQEEAVEQTKQIDDMEEVMQVLDGIEEEHTSGRLTLKSIVESFRDLQRRFPEEYKLGNLSCIACSFAVSMLIRVFQGWDPLQNPWHGMDVIAQWKDLLQVDDENHSIFEDAPALYSKLLVEVVFPAVRTAGINTWQARDPEPMLRFIELWEELLPPSVLQSLIDLVVLPKLSEAVNSWEPCRETIPIHVWVHPWLPLLFRKLETLLQDILEKFEAVLHVWNLSDMSAYNILSPWKTVFDAASWERLIGRFILPKLTEVMKQFRVDPANQKFDQFHWVMTWASAVPIHHMVSLLEKYFFCNWQKALIDWLRTKPNLAEVEQCYLRWNEVIPAEILANKRVQRQLIPVLEMMNQAALGLDEAVLPDMKEDVSSSKVREQRQYEDQETVTDNTESVPENLKEFVEAYAQHLCLIFKPKPGRSYNDLQVYSFGCVSIAVDSFNRKIFARGQEDWTLATLEDLRQMQKKQS